MADLSKQNVKFRPVSTSGVFPRATGTVNQFGLPDQGLRQRLNESLSPNLQGAAPPQAGGRPIFRPELTSALASIFTKRSPEEVAAAVARRKSNFGGLALERPKDTNQGASALRGPAIQADLLRPESILPVGAALVQSNAQVAPSQQQTLPAQPFGTPTTPAPVSVPQQAQPSLDGPNQLTARSFSPGVTEIVGGTGSRLFTNLIEAGATPEQATGFGRAVATGDIPLPGQLNTTNRAITGDQIAVNRLLNRQEPVAGAQAAGQPNGFGSTPTGTRRAKLVQERNNFEARGTIGGQRAASIRSKQIAALDKEARAANTDIRATQQLGINTARLDLDIANAAAKVKADLAKGTKESKFKFVLGETDLLTGQPKAPSITIGNKIIGLDPAVATAIDRTAKANFARFRAANPQDDTPPADLLELYTKQAFLDNVGTVPQEGL